MIRRADVAVVPALAASRPPAALAVVIDVLRATSTIVTALDHGATAVIPVREQDEAIATMRRLGRERVLLCGERDSRLIAGFDLDNSPASYERSVVAGKLLAFTTTNGTRALHEASRGRGVVYAAALLNRAAIADELAAADAEDALLICAGDEGELSFEDLFGAGAILDGLQARRRGIELSDAARAALAVYAHHEKRATTALAASNHAKALVAAGFADDVARCARLDVSRCVPRYVDGMISAG